MMIKVHSRNRILFEQSFDSKNSQNPVEAAYQHSTKYYMQRAPQCRPKCNFFDTGCASTLRKGRQTWIFWWREEKKGWRTIESRWVMPRPFPAFKINLVSQNAITYFVSERSLWITDFGSGGGHHSLCTGVCMNLDGALFWCWAVPQETARTPRSDEAEGLRHRKRQERKEVTKQKEKPMSESSAAGSFLKRARYMSMHGLHSYIEEQSGIWVSKQARAWLVHRGRFSKSSWRRTRQEARWSACPQSVQSKMSAIKTESKLLPRKLVTVLWHQNEIIPLLPKVGNGHLQRHRSKNQQWLVKVLGRDSRFVD